MKVLGIESSSLTASVAVQQDAEIVAEFTVNYKKTHSQTLLPMLDEMMRMAEQDPESLDGIAVSEGPGSFTGLRIGSATAKGLGLALNRPLMGIPTVDAMAFQLFGCAHLICPVMDAKRQQVYTGLYRFEETFTVIRPACAVALQDLLTELGKQERKVVFLGDGVPVFGAEIREALGDQALFAPAPCARQRAAAVAALGMQYLKEGRTQTAAEHRPNYIRCSQAERVRAQKQSGS